VALGNLGTIYQHQGRYSAALQSYQEAIDVLNKLKDKKGVAEYTKWMGSALLDLHSLNPSKAKLDEAMKLAKEIGSTELAADIQILMSRFYRLQGSLDSAEKELQDAIKHATEQQYERALLAARIEEAWNLSVKSDLAGAQKAAAAALKNSKRLGDVWLTNSCSYVSAYIHLQNKEPKQTIALAEGILPVLRKMGLRPQLYEFHLLAGEAFLALNERIKGTNHLQEAFRYFEEVKKGVDQQYLSDMMQDMEAQRLQQALQSLNLAKKVS
jgi:tetratricopeptide (TPR) repeat protein